MNREEIYNSIPNRHKTTHGYNLGFCDGAEWMQEQKQAEIDELSNKVSELTEALDASHVFSEGVEEHYIAKACDVYCRMCHHQSTCPPSEWCEKLILFELAMRGE